MTLAPRSQSRIPRSSPRSQCALTSKSNSRGVPQRRTSTFSSSSAPTGTESFGVFGSVTTMALSFSSIAASSASISLIAAETFCIAAICSEASSLLRLA